MHPDDAILARADCAWLRNGSWQSGSLVLSERQLTFWISEQGITLRTPVFSISGSMVTGQGRLMVQAGDQLWFSGAAVATLGHRLAALRDTGEQEFEADEVIHLSGPSHRWLGPIPLSGVAALTSHRLRFTASGLLSRLLRRLGFTVDLDLSIPLPSLPLRGPLARLIALYLQADRPLTGWLVRQRLRILPVLLTDTMLHIDQSSLPLTAISSVTASDHTLTLGRQDGDPITLRLPHASVACQRIQRAIHPPTDSAPCLREVEMHSTWDRDSVPDRVRPWSVERQSALLSQTRATRLHMPDGDILEMTPGLATLTRDGIGIALPEHMACPAPGTAVSVELGQPDGIHRFDSVVLRIAPLPAAVQIPRRGHLLVLSAPEEIRYFNRRSAFRVPLHLQVNAWRLRADTERQTWVPDGGRIAGELLDLSESGCAIQTADSVPIGTRMFLELRIAEHWIPLEAEVVRSGQGWPMHHTRLGIQFLNVPDRLGRLLSQTVLEQQRRSV